MRGWEVHQTKLKPQMEPIKESQCTLTLKSRILHCESWIYQQTWPRTLDTPGWYAGLPKMIQRGNHGIGRLCEAGLIRAWRMHDEA
jgi:hypothetical protein